MKIGLATLTLVLSFAISGSALAESAAYTAKLKEAESGVPAAMAAIGNMHGTKGGADAPYDIVKAYTWLQLAAKCEPKQEQKEAYLRNVNKFALNMNAKEVREGEISFTTWKGKCKPAG